MDIVGLNGLVMVPKVIIKTDCKNDHQNSLMENGAGEKEEEDPLNWNKCTFVLKLVLNLYKNIRLQYLTCKVNNIKYFYTITFFVF